MKPKFELSFFKNMKLTPTFTAPLLSFLLPGLGQLFQQRTIPAVLFFSAFTVFNAVEMLCILAPLVILLASFEAYRWQQRVLLPKKNDEPEDKKRVPAFFIVGVLGFVSWVLLVPVRFLPMGKAIRAQNDAHSLASEMRFCKESLSYAPKNLDECGEGAKVWDQWGRLYEYRLEEQGFRILSVGPDGTEDTHDDYQFSYAW